MQPELFDWKPPAPPVILGDRDGVTIVPERDTKRLNAQAQRVWNVLSDGRWYSLSEIAAITHDPEASISARIRDLRKPKFGGFTVEETCVRKGLHRYKLHVPA